MGKGVQLVWYSAWPQRDGCICCAGLTGRRLAFCDGSTAQAALAEWHGTANRIRDAVKQSDVEASAVWRDPANVTRPSPDAATAPAATAAAAAACALRDAWRLKERRSISKKAKNTALLMPLLSARGPTPLKNAVGPPCTKGAYHVEA